jgi:hypothetical protein
MGDTKKRALAAGSASVALAQARARPTERETSQEPTTKDEQIAFAEIRNLLEDQQRRLNNIRPDSILAMLSQIIGAVIANNMPEVMYDKALATVEVNIKAVLKGHVPKTN